MAQTEITKLQAELDAAKKDNGEAPFNTTSTPIKTIPLIDWMKSTNNIQFNDTVGINLHGFPFVTFINGDNKAENVYFSKRTSAKIAKGQPVNAQFLSQFAIADTKNADGEIRTKLVSNTGNRGSIIDLIAFEAAKL